MSKHMGDKELAELAQIWRRAKHGDRDAVEQIAVRYQWLPARIAGAKRGPAHVEREDILSWANFGLFDAIRKFDPDSGDGQLHLHFIGYATLRINGAILDGMKAPGQSWAPRDAWRLIKAMHEASEVVEQALGRPGTRAEVAAHMGVAEKDLPCQQWQVTLDPPTDDDINPMEHFADPTSTEESAFIADMASRVAGKIPQLPRVHYEMAAALFYDGMDLRALSEVTGVPIGRARALRAQMLLNLRDLLQEA